MATANLMHMWTSVLYHTRTCLFIWAQRLAETESGPVLPQEVLAVDYTLHSVITWNLRQPESVSFLGSSGLSHWYHPRGTLDTRTTINTDVKTCVGCFYLYSNFTLSRYSDIIVCLCRELCGFLAVIDDLHISWRNAQSPLYSCKV